MVKSVATFSPKARSNRLCITPRRKNILALRGLFENYESFPCPRRISPCTFPEYSSGDSDSWEEVSQPNNDNAVHGRESTERRAQTISSNGYHQHSCTHEVLASPQTNMFTTNQETISPSPEEEFSPVDGTSHRAVAGAAAMLGI